MIYVTIFYTFIAILAGLIVISLLWRLLSNRKSIPCPPWLGWMVERENPFITISRAATIIENSGISEGMTVLDAGCGPGRVTIPVALKVDSQGRVVAMDIQSEMLTKVEKKAQKENLFNIDYLEAGLGKGQLKYDHFDQVLLITVLGEIPDQEAALKEIYQTLKPKGKLVVTEVIFDPHFQRRSTVLKLAETVGFREREHFGGRLAYTVVLEKA